MVLLGTAIDFVRDFCFRKENRIVVESIDKYGEKSDLRKMSMKHGMNHNDVYIIYRWGPNTWLKEKSANVEGVSCHRNTPMQANVTA